jgi:hypothetical protein
MIQRAKRALFLATLSGGLAGGAAGGVSGGALGLGHSIFALSPEDVFAGIVAGAIIGLFPALVVAVVSVERFVRVPRPRTRITAPVHAAVFAFLAVTPILAFWVGSTASC